MADPSLAVVVPTYRRPRQLERCLRALSEQTVTADRVVVVVREGDGDTERSLARLQSDVLRFERAVVREPGVIAALEAGLACCSEQIVAHTDDDAAPHPDWLERLVASYEPDVGGVGGRDVLKGQEPLAETLRVVGRLTWLGRLHGNHHLGVGPPREVDALKGASFSMRRELWRLDRNLRGDGAQVHWEVGVCLAAKRDGWRLIYDPAAKVDHSPAPRFDADRRRRPTLRARTDAEWNYAYVLARHVPRWRLPAVALYGLVVGRRSAPGPLTVMLLCARCPASFMSLAILSVRFTAARMSGFAAGVRRVPR